MGVPGGTSSAWLPGLSAQRRGMASSQTEGRAHSRSRTLGSSFQRVPERTTQMHPLGLRADPHPRRSGRSRSPPGLPGASGAQPPLLVPPSGARSPARSPAATCPLTWKYHPQAQKGLFRTRVTRCIVVWRERRGERAFACAIVSRSTIRLFVDTAGASRCGQPVPSEPSPGLRPFAWRARPPLPGRPGACRVRPGLPDHDHDDHGDPGVRVRVQRAVLDGVRDPRSALVAAEAGNASGADCAILKQIEVDVTAPADRSRITQVVIYRSDQNGAVVGGQQNVYTRLSSTTCTMPDNTTVTVPYSASTKTYLEANRCNVLAGCPSMGSGRTLDTIGVKITYQHTWVTPLSNLVSLNGTGTTIVQSNAMRMEPCAVSARERAGRGRPGWQCGWHRSSWQRGQSLVEFALSSPVPLVCRGCSSSGSPSPTTRPSPMPRVRAPGRARPWPMATPPTPVARRTSTRRSSPPCSASSNCLLAGPRQRCHLAQDLSREPGRDRVRLLQHVGAGGGRRADRGRQGPRLQADLHRLAALQPPERGQRGRSRRLDHLQLPVPDLAGRDLPVHVRDVLGPQ